MPWIELLSVGVDSIDTQHKKWFEMADRLFSAVRNRKAGEFITQMLVFLEDYTKKHFSDEEEYMRRIGYPEYDVQKSMHNSFIRELSELKKRICLTTCEQTQIMEAHELILNWLTNHIVKQDAKIGEYVSKSTQYQRCLSSVV